MPVWCEVVADTLTPVACFANVVGDGDGFLFESVEGGERWGRYSFVGRRPLATLTARGRRSTATGPLACRPTTASWPPSRPGGSLRIADLWPACRPCTAGWSATWATTWCARSSGCPHPPPDDLGHPDAALVVIGQFAAFDHWRQRIMLIDNVVVPEGPAASPIRADVAAAYDGACERLRRAGRRLRPAPGSGEMVPAPRAGCAGRGRADR